MDCKWFRWVLKLIFWPHGKVDHGLMTLYCNVKTTMLGTMGNTLAARSLDLLHGVIFDHSVKFQAENRGKAIKRPTFTKCIRQGCQCGILEPTTDHKIFRFVLFGVNLPTLT